METISMISSFCTIALFLLAIVITIKNMIHFYSRRKKARNMIKQIEPEYKKSVQAYDEAITILKSSITKLSSSQSEDIRNVGAAIVALHSTIIHYLESEFQQNAIQIERSSRENLSRGLL